MRKNFRMFCFMLMFALAIGFAGSTPGYAQTEAKAAEFGDGVGEQGIGEISEETLNTDDADNNVEMDNTNADETEFDDSDIPEVSAESDVNVANTETLTYTHWDKVTEGNVTLKVEWNNPVLGEDTAFHVSATGGSGQYKYYLAAPAYASPNSQFYESVADPSREEFWKYTDVCESYDYFFNMTASGTYCFSFYVMDMGKKPYVTIRKNIYIPVSDDRHPSVDSIVSNAVRECNSKPNGSDYEKALWLHDWLLNQLEYDRSLKWSSAESALTRGLGTCQAYESAYAKLLTAVGIENAETRDTADGHTWNAMKLDGKWYQVDCTWDDKHDNYYNFDSTKLYFGLTDELMALAHSGHTAIYTGNEYATRSTSLADNYFVRHGEAAEWAQGYAERIQNQLNSKTTEFTIVADNAAYPPSISGIQNGIIAYAMNQMKWTADGQEVTLNVVGKDKEFTFAPVYGNSVNGDKLYAYSLNLDGAIAINMYMDLPETVVSNQDAYMEFVLPNGKKSNMKVSDARQKDGHYIFTCRVAAKEMAQDVKAKMVVNGQNGQEYTVSVQKYAELLLNNNNYQSLAPLVKSMLNYGAAAQIHFSYHVNELANSIPEMNENDKIVNKVVFQLADKADFVKGEDSGIHWYANSLVLESDTCYRYYFYLDSGNSIDDYSFFCNSVSLNPVEKEINGKMCYYIEIPNIKAQNLADKVKVVVSKTGQAKETMTIGYSAFSYAYDLQQSAQSDDNLSQVTYAMYQYWQLAKQYVDSRKA